MPGVVYEDAEEENERLIEAAEIALRPVSLLVGIDDQERRRTVLMVVAGRVREHVMLEDVDLQPALA